MPVTSRSAPLPSSQRAEAERRAAAGMALFHVARYAGPEAAGPEVGADGRARALLERLQSRARERQQQRQPPPQEPEEAVPTAGAAGKRRRRPRRPRRRRSSGTPGSPHAPRRKRRKADGEDSGAGGPAGQGAVRGPGSAWG